MLKFYSIFIWYLLHTLKRYVVAYGTVITIRTMHHRLSNDPKWFKDMCPSMTK